MHCKAQKSELFKIDPTTLIENEITLADIIDDISYIPLDNSIPFIGRLVQVTEGSVFLKIRDGILVFNREGKLPKRIGNKGRGPGEYTMGNSFTVDNMTETVYVKDIDFKIKVYSKDGKFLRTILLPKSEDNFDFDEIDFLNSHLFVSQFINMGHAKYNWIIMDTLGNFIKSKLNSVPTFKTANGFRGGTYVFENKIHYWNFYNDTIFSILSDFNYRPRFLFAKGKHRWPANPTKPDQFSQFMFPASLFETNRFFVFSYNYNEKRAIVLFDKRNMKSYMKYLTDSEDGLINNFDCGIMFHPRQDSYFVENGREYLAGLIEPLKLKSLVKSDNFRNSTPKFPEKKKELEKLANSLKETDNPVLMMVRLKK